MLKEEALCAALLGLALCASLIAAGCGGGGSTPATSSSAGSANSSTGSGAGSASETAIATTNAVGTPLTSLSNYNSATSGLQSSARTTQSVQLGTCQTSAGGGSYEFFSPDKNGDANSTEQQYFYDGACTQVARDIVRLFTSTGAASETVNRTAKIFTAGNGTAIATRTDSVAFTNATFDQYGFPNAAAGFDRAATGSLQYAGANTTNSDDELVLGAASGATQSFCGDAAGYSASGIPALGETFGWQGAVAAGGTRTVNGDGSVTWNATHAGSAVKGSIGSLAIAVGAQNTACPIAQPMFTISGGTSFGAYSIPTIATYKSGLLIGLTISNATLAGGATLNVTTNTSVSPMNSMFITGTVAGGGSQTASFNVNAFGDGTLTMTSGGAQYVIADWHVVK